MLARKRSTSFSFFEVHSLPLNRYKYLSAGVLKIQFTKGQTRAMFVRLLLSLPPIDIKAGALLFTGCFQTCASLQFFKPGVSRSNECLRGGGGGQPPHRGLIAEKCISPLSEEMFSSNFQH